MAAAPPPPGVGKANYASQVPPPTRTLNTHTHTHPHTQTWTGIQQEDMALINSDCGATRSLRYQTALITSESQDGNAWGAKSDRA